MKNSTIYNILTISRIANTYRRNKLNEIDLNPALHLYISYIYRHPGCKQEEFIEHFCLDKTTVTHQLNHLEKLGYITRQTNQDDGRCRLVFPTDSAIQIYPKIHETFNNFRTQIFEGLSEEEMDLLEKLTNKLTENGRKLL